MKDIPVLERQVSAQSSGSTPNFGEAIGALAESQNSLSAIGSKVAQVSSNAMAEKLGYETGKNPQGDLFPSLTEFDKHFADSYHQQANAVLTLQGQKLLDDVQIQLAQANRLTPGLIANANQQLQSGLAKITENAPTVIKGKLEASFASSMLEVNKHNQLKLINEQREDTKNNLNNAIDLNQKKAYELGVNGDVHGSQNAYDSAKSMADSLYNNHLITAEEHRVKIETAKQNQLNGQFINMANTARSEGKLEEFEKKFADKKLPGMDKLTNEQWVNSGSAVMRQMNFYQSMANQNAQLQLAQFKLKMTEDATSITPDDILSLKQALTPTEFANAQADLAIAQKKANKQNESANEIANDWSNPDVHAKGTTEQVNQAFNQLVKNAMQKNNQLPQAEAEMQVAMAAGAPVKEYVNTLNARLKSGDPQKTEEALMAIDRMYHANQGQNLQGLDEKALAMGEAFNVFKQSQPLPEAAQAAKQMVYGKTPQQKEANDQAWDDYRKEKIQSGKAGIVALNDVAGLSKNTFIRNGQAYAKQFENTFEKYFKLTNGDVDLAQKMLKRAVSQTYGYTTINGQKEYTYLPVAQTIGVSDDYNGVIQTDIAHQLEQQFESTNKAYDEGKSDWKWMVKPTISIDEARRHHEVPQEFAQSKLRQEGFKQLNIQKFNTQNKVEVIKIYRDGRTEKFDTILQANPYSAKTIDPNNPVIGGWDIMLSSKNGMLPIYTLDPRIGNAVYHPNVPKIKADYWALTRQGNK